MLTDAANTLDLDAALEHYRLHGYARLGKMIQEPVLQALRERADDLMLGRVVYPGMFFQRDTDSGNYEDLTYGRGYTGPGLNYRKMEKLELDSLFRGLIENPLFERIARRWIGEAVTIYRSTLFSKGAEGGTYLPWHQDGGKFWGLDRDPTLQIWTALDDASLEAGPVEVIPGSHLGGLASPLGGVVQPEVIAKNDAAKTPLALPAEAGEVLLIHNYLWHRSGRNSTGKPRRALTTTYMDAATRCVRTKRPARTFFRVFS